MLFDDTPRGIMEALLVAGGIALALSAAPTLVMALAGVGYAIKARDHARHRKLQHSFQYLVRHGYAKREARKASVSFRLTPQGRKRIERYLDERKLLVQPPRPAHWDGRWRIILFDIPAAERTKRNAFRSLIRRLGAIMLQKSVWIYPFDCTEQISLLKNIFGFTGRELRLLSADAIGDESEFRTHFRI